MISRHATPLVLLALASAFFAPTPTAGAFGGEPWHGTIPADGTPVTTTLAQGAYTITASGTYVYAFNGSYADAAFSFDMNPSYPPCYQFPGNVHALLLNGQNVWGSQCHASHLYSVNYYCPSTCLLTFEIFDSAYEDNSGSLSVDVQPGDLVVLDTDVPLTPDVTLPPPDVLPTVGSVRTYDAQGGQLCVDVTLQAQTTQVACVSRAGLGPADALVPRGTLLLPPVALATAPGTHLGIVATAHYDPAILVEEATADGGALRVVAPFGPDTAAAFLADQDATRLDVMVYVSANNGDWASVPVSIPYLGQVVAAAAFSQAPSA